MAYIDKRKPLNPAQKNEWRVVLMENEYRCVLCGLEGDEDTLQRDHIVAVARGGADEPENWQPLCSECNERKNARAMDALPTWRYWEWGAQSVLTHKQRAMVRELISLLRRSKWREDWLLPEERALADEYLKAPYSVERFRAICETLAKCDAPR